MNLERRTIMFNDDAWPRTMSAHHHILEQRSWTPVHLKPCIRVLPLTTLCNLQ